MSSVLFFDARGGPEVGALDWELKDSWEISCWGKSHPRSVDIGI